MPVIGKFCAGLVGREKERNSWKGREKCCGITSVVVEASRWRPLYAVGGSWAGEISRHLIAMLSRAHFPNQNSDQSWGRTQPCIGVERVLLM